MAKAAPYQAGCNACRRRDALDGECIVTERQRDGDRMRVDAIHQAVQIAELRRQPRVELQHRDAARDWLAEEFHVEATACEADRAQKASRHRQRGRAGRRRQRARIMPALESLGLRIHMRVDDAEQVDTALVDPAVEIMLGA